MSSSSSRAKSASARLPSRSGFPRATHSGLPDRRPLRRGLVGAGDGVSEDDYPYLDTHYNNDYRGLTCEELELCRPTVRPTSPTRLNNPHPDRTFMRWSGNEAELQKERLLGQAEVDAELRGNGAGKTQWFSKDFRELTKKDIENEYVMKYMGTMTRMKLSHEVPESTKIGLHTRIQPMAQGKSSAVQRQSPRTGIPVSRSTLQRSLRNASAVPALEEWLVDADPEEQQAVLGMMDAAEKSCLTKDARQHLRSGAAPRVERWMSSANPRERDVAASFLKTLSAAKPPPSRTGAASGTGKHHRSLSDNAASKLLHPAATHNRRHTEADINAPMLWHLKSDRDPRTGVVNRSSVYVAPHRYRGVHYRIHPDWPTYMK